MYSALRHGGTVNNGRAACPPVRLVEGEESRSFEHYTDDSKFGFYSTPTLRENTLVRVRGPPTYLSLPPTLREDFGSTNIQCAPMPHRDRFNGIILLRTDGKSLVFLQYQSETKRALLPNEITSMDTVRALFVRSFPKQLTMEYLDSPHIRVYIHDPAKDMFYELEDLRMLRTEVNKENIRFFLQFFFDKGENASQGAEIANGNYGADTVTANYVQFWFCRFRSGIFDF
ncbi:coiled-coil domain-containing protein CG32809 [Trichonephila clavipes]|nr:coiled-coil domain-containing protein CG32809 [Trichonephila clavipes]